MPDTCAYADRGRMNMNWYLNQELAAEQRRELVALRAGSARRLNRRWHLPHVAVARRWSQARPAPAARGVCQ